MLGAAVTLAMSSTTRWDLTPDGLILEFVMQFERDVGVIAAARAG
jgi:hypothetical protein